MVVGFSVEVSVSDDGSHRSHFCRSFSGGCLVMVAEDYPNFGPLQLPNAVGRREHVVLGEQRSSTVEVAVIDDPGHPWIVVDPCGTPPYDPVLVVGSSAF